MDFHHLLLAGLPAHTASPPEADMTGSPRMSHLGHFRIHALPKARSMPTLKTKRHNQHGPAVGAIGPEPTGHRRAAFPRCTSSIHFAVYLKVEDVDRGSNCDQIISKLPGG